VTLNLATIGEPVEITAVGGERGFRRRLLELGLLPGSQVTVVRVAPLGDPMELESGGTHLSIRLRDAEHIRVSKVRAAAE
jgi:Fe2+ transport system protein FeoA